MNQLLKKKSRLREQEMGGELMICDEERDLVHVLNATSAFIWRCLDDTTDVAAIETRVRERFGAAPERNVQSLVEKALKQFQEKNLVEIESSAKSSKPSS
jgi:hypothetical protein